MKRPAPPVRRENLVDLSRIENHGVPTASDSIEENYACQADAFADGKPHTAWVTGRVMREHWASVKWRKIAVTLRRIELDFTPRTLDYDAILSYIDQRKERIRVRTRRPRAFQIEALAAGRWTVIHPWSARIPWSSRFRCELRLPAPLRDVKEVRLRLRSRAADECFAVRAWRLLGDRPVTSRDLRPVWKAEWIWGEREPAVPNFGFVRRFFRRVFTVADPRAIREARLLFVAYDRGIVFLNGHEIARTNSPVLGLNRLGARVRVPPRLFRKGRNLLAIQGEIVENHRFSFGILAELWIARRHGARQCLATAPGTFQVSTVDDPGWNRDLDGFDRPHWIPAQPILQPATSYGVGRQPLRAVDPNAEPAWMYTEEYTPPWFDGAVRISRVEVTPKIPRVGERFALEVDVRVRRPLADAYAMLAQYGEQGPAEIRSMDFSPGEGWLPPQEALPRGFRGKKTLVLRGVWPEGVSACQPVWLRFCNARAQLAFEKGSVGELSEDPHPGRLRVLLGRSPFLHARAVFPRCRILPGGRISIDGQVVAPILYTSSISRSDLQMDYLASGIRLFRIVPQNTCSLVPSQEPEETHYRRILRLIRLHAEAVLSVAPEARFLLMLRLDMPNAWKQEHPEEWIVMGRNQTLMPVADPREIAFGYVQETPNAPGTLGKTRRAVREFLRLLKREAYASSVIGIAFYHGIAGENYFGLENNLLADRQGRIFLADRKDYLIGDVGYAARRSLRDWLRAKYRTRRALARAWKVPDMDFDDVVNPAKWPNQEIHARLMWHDRPAGRFIFRDRREEGNFYHDFVRHQNEARVELFSEACREVKRASGGRLLAGGYSGCYALPALSNSVPGGIQHCAQAAWQKLMDCPHMDWCMSPSIYHMRRPGDPSMSMGLDDSPRLRGKIWMHEFDSRTFLCTLPPKTFSQEATLHQLRKEFGYALSKEQGWWWLEFLFGSSGAMAAPWFSDPRIKADARIMKRVYERYQQIARPGPSAQIAILVHVEQAFFTDAGDPANTLHANITNQFLPKFHWTGAPFDLYSLGDLPRIARGGLLDQYRLLVLPNAFFLDRPTRNLLRDRAQRDGRTLLFLYAPGYQGNHLPGTERSLAGIEEVTGMKGIARLPETHLLGMDWRGAGDALRGIAPGRHDAVTWWGPEFAAQIARFGHAIAPIFWLDPRRSNGWTPLARLRLDRQRRADMVAFAERRARDHRVLYSAVPDLPLSLLAKVVRDSGVHAIADPGVVAYANRHLLCVQPREDRAQIELAWREPVRWIEPFERKVYGEQTARITLRLRRGETRIFCLERQGEWSDFLGDA